MDPRNGEILALASNPTFKPNVFVGRVEQRKLAAAGLTQATAPESNYPALNRALAGVYLPGSAWKPVTALAGMEEHLLAVLDSAVHADVRLRGRERCRLPVRQLDDRVRHRDDAAAGARGRRATRTSTRSAAGSTSLPERGHPFQNWARRFGFGESTGIELGGEATGLLPTPEWRKRAYAKSKDPLDRVWKPGDSIQLAIGQKDLLVTPLQMARFYR